MTSSSGSLKIKDCYFDEAEITGTSGDTVEVENCGFVIGGGYGIRMGLDVHDPDLIHVHHNTFLSGNKFVEEGISVSHATTDTIIIEDNVFDFRTSGQRGFQIYCDYGGWPLLVRNNLFLDGRTALYWLYTQGVIENNTILYSGNPSSPWPIDVELDDFQHLEIRNNIVVQGLGLPRFTVCEPCGPGARIDYVHNAFWPPVDSFYSTEEPAGYLTVADSANFNAYPMFADDSLYRLEAGSPLIDAGDPSILDSDGTRSDIGWTGGPSGISYDYEQLPPRPPDSLWVSGSDGIVGILWSSRPESDLEEYRLYRGGYSGFWMPGIQPHQLFSPADTTAADTLLSTADTYYYVVTAVDTAGLESDASPEGMYINTGVFDDPDIPAIPRTPYIARVYPNPFNAATTLDVVIPEVGAMPAPVRISLYDVVGGLVVVAYEGHLSAGRFSIQIRAVSAQGDKLASGVYFTRLKVWNTEFREAKKLVLLK